MTWHILGWLTVAAQVVGAVFLSRYLFDAFRHPWSWLRGPKAPKVEGSVQLGSGSDYVGLV